MRGTQTIRAKETEVSEAGLAAMSSIAACRQAEGDAGTVAIQLHRQGQPGPKHKKTSSQRWQPNQTKSHAGGGTGPSEHVINLKAIKSKERFRLHLKGKETICTSISYKESLWCAIQDHLWYLNQLENKEEMRGGGAWVGRSRWGRGEDIRRRREKKGQKEENEEEKRKRKGRTERRSSRRTWLGACW